MLAARQVEVAGERLGSKGLPLWHFQARPYAAGCTRLMKTCHPAQGRALHPRQPCHSLAITCAFELRRPAVPRACLRAGEVCSSMWGRGAGRIVKGQRSEQAPVPGQGTCVTAVRANARLPHHHHHHQQQQQRAAAQ